MINSSDIKKYIIDFLIVFIGILSSFGIDNYIKNVQRENQKKILLDELYLSINDDIIQLKIVNDALDDHDEDVDHVFAEQEGVQLVELEVVAVAVNWHRPPVHPTELRNKRHAVVQCNPSYVNKCVFLVNVFY